MLVQYKATQGLKLYGDEAFCLQPPRVPTPENLVTNGDLRFGGHGWDISGSFGPAIRDGKLQIVSDLTVGVVRQKLTARPVTESKPLYLGFTVHEGSVGLYRIRLRKVSDNSLTLDTGQLTVGTDRQVTQSVDLLTFTEDHWLEFVNDTASVQAYLYVTDIHLAVTALTGEVANVSAATPQSTNQISNSFFASSSAGWIAGANSTVSVSGGGILVSAIAAGDAVVTYALPSLPVLSDGYVWKLSYVLTSSPATGGRVSVGDPATLDTLATTSDFADDLDRNDYLLFKGSGAGIIVALHTLGAAAGVGVTWDNITLIAVPSIVHDEAFRLLTTAAPSNSPWVQSNPGTLVTDGFETTSGGSMRITLSQLNVGESYEGTVRLTIPSNTVEVSIRVGTSEASTTIALFVFSTAGTHRFEFVADRALLYLTVAAKQTDGSGTTITLHRVRLDAALPGAALGVSSGSYRGQNVLAHAAGNTDTGCVAIPGSNMSPSSLYTGDLESGLLAYEHSVQEVATGNWTYQGWVYVNADAVASSDFANVLFTKRSSNSASASLTSDPTAYTIRIQVAPGGKLQADISDDDGVTSDTVTTDTDVSGRWVFWELVRDGVQVHFRIDTNVASPRVSLLIATGSLDSLDGVNELGQFDRTGEARVYETVQSSAVRFVPSLVSLARSRAVYASESSQYLRDKVYTVLGESKVLVIDAPTQLDDGTQVQGNLIIADGGEAQEAVIHRVDRILSAASKELTYYESLVFRAFLEAVVRGGEFTYDPYSSDLSAPIQPYQVFYVGNSFQNTRIDGLEYFMYRWTMRVKGSQA